MRKIVRKNGLVATLTKLESGVHEGSWKIRYHDNDDKPHTGGIIKNEDKAREKAKKILTRLSSQLADHLSSDEAEMIKLIRSSNLSVASIRTLADDHAKCTGAVIGDVLPEWYLYHSGRKELSKSHLRTMRYVVDGVQETLGHHTPLADVNTSQLDDWLMSIKVGKKKQGVTRPGLAHKRFNNLRSILVTIWKWAVTKKYAAENVAQLIPQATAKKRSGGHEVFSPEEFAMILYHVDDDFLNWAVIAGFAGLRTSEICGGDEPKDRLQWGDFDWANKRIVVRCETSKTALPRYVPICDSLAAWLDGKQKLKGFVHNSCEPGYYSTDKTKSQTYKLARCIGDLKWRINGLRASRASYRLAQTNDLGLTSSEDGHTIDTLKKNYNNPRFAEDAELWFSLSPDKVKRMIDDKIVNIKQA